MKLEIAEAPVAALRAYAAVPSSFEVREVLEFEADLTVPNVFQPTVRTAALPVVKDYDASPADGPLNWPQRFDLRTWCLLLARSGVDVIGGAAIVFPAHELQVAQDQAVLWDLRVAPVARGQGAGTLLVRSAEDWARRHGAASIGVETQNINVPAYRLYVKAGFTLVDVRRGAYAEYPDEVQLWLQKNISSRAGRGGAVAKTKPVPVAASRPPTTRELTALLGESYAAFLALTQPGPGVTCEWRRYSEKTPWVLRVSQGERTLFYATPKVQAFEATVVLGKRATEAALDGRVPKKLHRAIRAARPYAEGRPVRIVVRGQADLASVEQLVAVKLNPTHGNPRHARSRVGTA